MKLPIVCLLSILAFVTAQVEEAFVDYETRFLADRVVTLSELQTHSTYANGLWTALGGIVYDITNFVHPGGINNILKAGGIEADTLYLKAYNKESWCNYRGPNQKANHQKANHKEANHQEANHKEANHKEANYEEADHQEANHQEANHQEANHREAGVNYLLLRFYGANLCHSPLID